MPRFRYEYGAGPVHLLVVLASYTVAAYAFVRIVERPDAPKVLLWLGCAIVAHDLVLLPLYSLVGLIAYGIARGGLIEVPAVSAFNHVRVPAVLSGLLLLVWFPLILGLGEDSYLRATGMTTDGYMERWLLVTAALFTASALLYALRLGRAARARRAAVAG